MSKIKQIHCVDCGDVLDDWETEDPYMDEGSEPVCSSCYHTVYEFTCAKCENYTNRKDDMLSIGAMFIAFDDIDLGIPQGTYIVTHHPFYADGMIEGRIYEDAIKIISDEVWGLSMNWYPMEFVCGDCAKKISASIDMSSQNE